jgi:hypothetical protein
LADLVGAQDTRADVAGPVGLGIKRIARRDEAALAGALERPQVTAKFRGIGAAFALAAEVLGSQQMLSSEPRRPEYVCVGRADMLAPAR